MVAHSAVVRSTTNPIAIGLNAAVQVAEPHNGE
jgi:hypothetical protein